MFRTTLLTTTLALTGALAAASGAAAATGHACQVNGAAAGCAAALNIPIGADLVATDPSIAAADDFVFAGPGNTMRCRDATAKGILTSAGGPAYPVGGGGPKGYLAGASITGPAGSACNGSVGGAPATGAVMLADGNGAAPGVVDALGDWASPTSVRLTLRAPVFVLRELTAAGWISCTYRGTAFTGAVANDALGRVSFVGQPVSKLAGPAPCPAAATISVPFNVRWQLGGGVGPFRISA